MKASEKLKRKNARNDKKQYVFNILIVAVFASALLLMGAYGGMHQVTDNKVFAQGTVVNGFELAGKIYEQAKEEVLKQERDDLKQISVKVTYNGNIREFTAADLGVSGNAEEILKQAYEYSRSGNVFSDYDHTYAGEQLESSILIDNEILEKNVKSFLDKYDTEPVEATAKFDQYTHKFTYTESSVGSMADADAVCAQIEANLKSGKAEDINVTGQRLNPDMTEEELKQNTVLIGRCETIATENPNRDVNIQLMCKALNGLVLQPGETLSVNGLVGERTAEKGFKAAPAIMDGKKLTDELGGGICQVAGTLYNAALLADMEIVERVHHSWPSAYLPVGLDATLNWDDKDLKLKNTSEYPMYLGADFYKHSVVIEIYGQPSEYDIEIENNILKEIDVPKPEIIYTDEIPAGERKTTITGRKGYEVDVYRNYLKDGEIVKSEKISHDYFHEIKGTILEGTNKADK